MKTTIRRERETSQVGKQALVLLKSRYLAKDDSGQIVETQEGMFRRVAVTIAAIERLYGATDAEVLRLANSFYRLMIRGAFLPNSPTLMNAGRLAKALLSACCVLPVLDSIRGIFKALLDAALVHKAGAGTGFDFSHLRPAGDHIRSSGGTSPGPVEFINVFAQATHTMAQGGLRQGANMAVLRIDHPDAVRFFRAKRIRRRLHNFNLSVAVTDDFVDALMRSPNQTHMVVNPRTGRRYPLRKSNGRYWTVRQIFNLLVASARKTGEPGILYIDRINQANPTPHVGRIEATNPCGEQPLLAYETCNLGSINLTKCVRSRAGRVYFDFRSFARVVRVAVRFLDNVIDANSYPIPQIARVTRGNRKIGLGVMGFADTLFTLGIPYNSDAALEFADQVMGCLQSVSHQASCALAERRGVFPNWKGSIWEQHGLPMRNACVTCIAPTGSISILAGCSAGIEPCFAVVFVRNILAGRRLLEINPVFEAVARSRGFYSRRLMDEIAKHGSIQHMSSIPADVRRVFVTALDISPLWHVRMMATFQRHCDGAVSKTVNLRKDATPEDVKEVLIAAHDLGCKGITVYRDGSRINQPMDHAGELAPAVKGPRCSCSECAIE